jgi:competence protein ComEA
MKSRKLAVFGLGTPLLAALLVPTLAASAHLSSTPVPQDPKLERAFLKVCSDCHEPERAFEAKRTRGDWESILEKMIEKGATGTDQDFELVLQYLLSQSGMVNVNQSTSEDIALVLGLTAKEADAIVAFRKQNGNYKNFDALTKVPDVDASKLEKHKESVIF